MSPAATCREAEQYIVRLLGCAIDGVDVGFIARGHDGDFGAFARMPGRSYTVTDASGRSWVLPLPS